MEQFTLLEGDHTLKESRQLINNALLTVRSLSAGTAFPTDNLTDGMLCYRTDLGRLYSLADAASGTWTNKLPADLGGTADAVSWAGILDKPAAFPAADHAHPYAGAAASGGSALSADKLAAPRTINGVAFDGTADITIDTGVKTINGSAPDAAGNLDIAGLPVGHEYFSLNPNLPTGSLPLTGGIYSREAYRDLWAWVQTQTGYLIAEDEWQLLSKKNNGSVPFYSSGDGSATFRVPSLACWIRGANGIEEVGSYLEAGLPNIEGTWKQALAKEYTTTEGTGALQPWASGTTVNNATGSGSTGGGILLDASLSNDIYGASDTVQPPSVIGIWLVKAFGTVDITGSQDLSDISAGLAIAESRIGQLENGVPSDYIVESYRNGTDWYEVYKSGKIRQGGIWKGSLSVPTDQAVAINVTFLKPFANTNYYASVMHRTQNTVFGGGMAAASEDASGKTTTSCKFYYTSFYAVRTITEACWVAEGQGA